jgi:spore maturation protein CgeB
MNYDEFTAEPLMYNENLSGINKLLKGEQADILFITAGNIPLKYNQVKNYKAGTKILFLTDDDWQFMRFSRMYGLCFDWIVTTYKNNLSLYLEHGFENVILSQWGVNTEHFIPMNVEKTIDVALIGAPHSNRAELVRKLLGDGINIKLFGKGWEKVGLGQFSGGYLEDSELPNVINKCKISITTLQSGDQSTLQIKGRIFEIAACKSFQLVEANPLLQEYFEEGNEIVTYNSYSDLKGKILNYLSNDYERNRIAQNAYYRIIKEHSWQKRIEKIYDAVNSSKPEKRIETIEYPRVIVYFKTKSGFMPDAGSINSLNNQTHTNFEICFIGSVSTEITSLKHKCKTGRDFASSLKENNAEYAAFMADGDYWEPEKLELQVFALQNDKRNGIHINLTNISVFDGINNYELFYYSYSDLIIYNAPAPKLLLPYSSVLLTQDYLLNNKSVITSWFENAEKDYGFAQTIKYPNDIRITDMQYCLVKMPLKSIKINSGINSAIEYENYWHWYYSSWSVLFYFITSLKIKKVYILLKQYFLSKKHIYSFIKASL